MSTMLLLANFIALFTLIYYRNIFYNFSEYKWRKKIEKLYWDTVAETNNKLFHNDICLNNWKKEVKKMNEDEKAIFFNHSPLDMSVDMNGVEITEDDVKFYDSFSQYEKIAYGKNKEISKNNKGETYTNIVIIFLSFLLGITFIFHMIVFSQTNEYILEFLYKIGLFPKNINLI